MRREFIKAEKDFPAQSKVVIDLIRGLYDVEELCPAEPEGDTMRIELRQERSKPIISELRSFAETTRVVPHSSLDKAIKYMAGLWSGLVRFLDDPRIPIDTSAKPSESRCAAIIGTR